MSEDELLPEDFDLEEFQRQVEQELMLTFHVYPSDTIDIGQYPGEQVVTTIKRVDIPKPPKPKSPRFPNFSFLNDPFALLAMGSILLLGFILGGGNLLVNSPIRNVVGGLSILLIVRAGDKGWERWRLKKQAKQRAEKQEQLRREEEAKKRIALLQADKLLAKPEFKAKLCPALQDLSNNIFEMSKSVANTLVTISLLGQVPLTVTPLLVAAVTVVLVKSGIAFYCAEYAKK